MPLVPTMGSVVPCFPYSLAMVSHAGAPARLAFPPAAVQNVPLGVGLFRYPSAPARFRQNSARPADRDYLLRCDPGMRSGSLDPPLEMSIQRAPLRPASRSGIMTMKMGGTRRGNAGARRFRLALRGPNLGSTAKPGANWVSPQPGILSPILINGAANMSHYGHIDCCWAASPAVWVG